MSTSYKHDNSPVNHDASHPCVQPGSDRAKTSNSSSRAETRITSAPIVANCLDTLKINWSVFWPEDVGLFKRLEAAKNTAQSYDDDSYPVKIGGIEWNCARTGTSRFSYRLNRGDIRLLLSSRRGDAPIPNTRLEIGSMSCWSPGFQEIHGMIIGMLEKEGGKVENEKVAEVHLAADFINVDLRTLATHKESQWITRAHNFAAYYNLRTFTGITLGKGNIMLRVYDKVFESRTQSHKKQFFEKIWDFDIHGEAPVTRVEFQVRRPILSEFDPQINNLSDLTNSLASVWQYCSKEWCRLAGKDVDRNHHQSRAETSPWWESVQEVIWNDLTPSYRNKRQLHKDLGRIVAQAAGSCMSIAASFGCGDDDVEGAIKLSCQLLSSRLRVSYHDDPEKFETRMKSKKIDFLGIEGKPLPFLPQKADAGI